MTLPFMAFRVCSGLALVALTINVGSSAMMPSPIEPVPAEVAAGPVVQEDERDKDLRPEVPAAANAAAESPLDLSLDSVSFAELNHVAANEEYGIHALFPEGSVVCEARSWEHPVGLFADIDRARDCDAPFVDRLVRMIGINAHYNAYFGTSIQRELPCEAGSLPSGMSLDFREFAFQGMESLSCASLEKDGQIWVHVAGLGGGLSHNDPPEAPVTHLVVYSSSLGTHREHLREDLALYREFLRRLRFSPAE